MLQHARMIASVQKYKNLEIDLLVALFHQFFDDFFHRGMPHILSVS